jgi:hypothetical protein
MILILDLGIVPRVMAAVIRSLAMSFRSPVMICAFCVPPVQVRHSSSQRRVML